jgi:antitoxin component of MazEF toxin-antitoxin module
MMSGENQMPADTETSVSDAAEQAMRRRYTLDELIAKCDLTAPAPEIDRLWTEGAPVGDEVI